MFDHITDSLDKTYLYSAHMAAWKQKRRDPLTLEERRINGVRMIVEQGFSEHEVARRLGVTQGAVSQWYSAYRRRNGGDSYDALKKGTHIGRPSRLNRRQLASIPRILLKGAEHYGFSTDLWTAERLAKVIEEKYDIQYSSSQVARILGSMNFSYQKPERAGQENTTKRRSENG